MPDADAQAPPHNDDEREIEAMADGLREGLRDPATRRHVARIAAAALGDDANDEPAPPADPHERT
jgi:hypothetical protein